MLKTKRCWVPVLVMAGLLAGCVSAPPLSRTQLNAVQRGDTLAAVRQNIKPESVNLEYRFSANDRDYLAQHYRVETGITESTTVVCTPGCFPVPIIIPIFTPYVIVYEADPPQRVLSYGTIEELSKNPDDAVSSVMPSLKLAMEKASAAKNAGGSSKCNPHENSARAPCLPSCCSRVARGRRSATFNCRY